MRILIDFVLRNRALVMIAVLLTALLGAYAWTLLPIDAFPDVTNQQVMVLTEAEGLGPEDVERQVTIPVETVMGGLPDVKLVRSLSKSGLSLVVVIFEDAVDTYFARQLVVERLQMARESLPPGIEPELGPISTGLGEILQYTLRSDEHGLMELRTMQDWIIAPRLRSVAGVNEVNSFGGEVRQVEVSVRPEALLAYDIALHEVTEALAANNANTGGGFIVQGWEQENIRNVGLFENLQDIRNVVLRAKDGTTVSIADVADVSIGRVTRLGGVSRDGEGEVVAGMVIMLKGENAKEVVERVKAALPSIEGSLPDGVSIDLFYDRTDLVRAVTGTVSKALLQGGVFVILVLLLVIGNLRGALVAALSLPVTALVTFLMMGAAGLTANLMTLGGLAVAIGMVVDGSIVITENIARHWAEARGRERLTLIADAVREVGRPIVFSILIIVIVFLPLLTLEGMEGKMFGPLALTLIFAMMGSLVVAMVAVPAAMSFLLRGKGGEEKETRLLVMLRDAYLRLLDVAMRRRKVTVTVALLLLVVVLAFVPRLGTEFLPELDEGAIAINVVRLPNASLDGSVRTSSFMEQRVLAFPEVKTVVSKTGRAEISEDPMGPEQTDLLVMLHPEREWTTGRSKAELVEALQADLAAVPGQRLAFSQPIALRVNELISGVKSDLAVKVFGPDIETLKEFADRVASTLRGLDGAEDVSVEQVSGFSQLDIIPDRRAIARHQIGVADIGEIVGTALGGSVATEIVDGQTRYGVQVRFPESARNSEEAILDILLPTPSGARVPLGQVAQLRRVEGPAQVSRENGMRRVVVETNVRSRDLGGFVGDAKAALADVTAELPAGYWLEYGGTFANQQRAMARLAVVVPLSILLIFLMLFSSLRSLGAAGLVLVNLPFALIGGVLAMLIFRINLNVPATVGFIALFGTAVQNDMVLVTFIEQLRAEGMAIGEAVRTACRLRFRALLMTALTTVLGLLPMLYAMGPGAEIQRPLAVVVIGGLISATALTMLLLPAIYELAHGRRDV